MNSLKFKNTQTNRDFRPVAYYMQLKYQLSLFSGNYWYILIILTIIIVFLASKLSPISLAMFSAGFSASSIEIIILMSLQMIYGYIFQMTGIIITVFMAGLAIGSLFLYKYIKIKTKNLIVNQIYIGFYSLVLPFVLISLKHNAFNTVLLHLIFSTLAFLIAIIVGIQFSLSTKLHKSNPNKIASEIYSGDMLGSAIGALIISTVLIPLIGIINVCFIIGAINFITAGIVYVFRKQTLL